MYLSSSTQKIISYEPVPKVLPPEGASRPKLPHGMRARISVRSQRATFFASLSLARSDCLRFSRSPWMVFLASSRAMSLSSSRHSSSERSLTFLRKSVVVMSCTPVLILSVVASPFPCGERKPDCRHRFVLLWCEGA